MELKDIDIEKALITVESPTKADSYIKYMGIDTVATKGHFKDLPKSALGIDLNSYEPSFEITNQQVAKSLRLKAKGKDVYIAADADREGFAIGYMTYETIKDVARNIYKIETREITKKGITKALNSRVLYKDINISYYYSFLGRRMGDRIVGYLLSPIVSKILSGKYSVGRIQSPSVRLIYEREIAIEKFKPENYYSIDAFFKAEGHVAKAIYEDTHIINKNEAGAIISDLTGLSGVIEDIKTKTASFAPRSPYDTADFQIDASGRLKLSPTKAMDIAQELFELGFITYHRTDYTSFGDDFNEMIRGYILNKYGIEKLPPSMIKHDSSGSQDEAHEGIRPLDLNADISSLNENQTAVYNMIFNRAVASQMKNSIVITNTIIINIGGLLFNLVGKTIDQEGHLEVMPNVTKTKENILPKVEKGDEFRIDEFTLQTHETNPPKRYTEASLIKELKKMRMGRPATYAPTVENIQKRGYVELKGGSGKVDVFYSLPMAKNLIELLLKEDELKWVVDYDFTIEMEKQLDLIKDEKIEYKSFLKEIHSKMNYYKPKDTVKNFIDKECLCCGGKMIENDKVFVCENYKYDKDSDSVKGCQFIIWKNPIGFTLADIDDIYRGKEYIHTKDGKDVVFALNAGLIERCKGGDKNKFKENFVSKKLNQSGHKCPLCNSNIVYTEKQYHCEKNILKNINNKFVTKGCKFRINKTNAHVGYVLDDDTLEKILQKETIILDNKKEIFLNIDNDYFIQTKSKAESTGIKCPKCKSDVVESDKMFFCGNKKDKCEFKIWKESNFKKYSIDKGALVKLLAGEDVLTQGKTLRFAIDNKYFIETY